MQMDEGITVISLLINCNSKYMCLNASKNGIIISALMAGNDSLIYLYFYTIQFPLLFNAIRKNNKFAVYKSDLALQLFKISKF